MINFNMQNVNKLQKKAKKSVLISGMVLLGSIVYLGVEVHADELIATQPTGFQEQSESTAIKDSAYFELMDVQDGVNTNSENIATVTNEITFTTSQLSEVTNSMMKMKMMV